MLQSPQYFNYIMNILFNALQVSDVNDDVRRAAVESLGFILFRYCTFVSHFHSF